MSEATTAVPASAQAATVLERSVCLVLRCSKLGNQRHVSLDNLDLSRKDAAGEREDVTADKRQLGLSKRLLDTALLNPVERIIDAAKADLRVLATPGHKVFGDGTWLVPIASLQEADHKLAMRKLEFEAAVHKLSEAYPAAVEAQREKLGQLFAPTDYLSQDEVRAEYAFDWSYISFAAPENLLDVDRAIYERAVLKTEQRLAAAYAEVEADLRETGLRIVRELADRLRPGEDGKHKALRGTALRDLQDYLSHLPHRNSVVGDTELPAALQELEALAEGLDVDMLKKAPAIRQQLLDVADRAVAGLDGLVATVRRGIRLQPATGGGQ